MSLWSICEVLWRSMLRIVSDNAAASSRTKTQKPTKAPLEKELESWYCPSETNKVKPMCKEHNTNFTHTINVRNDQNSISLTGKYFAAQNSCGHWKHKQVSRLGCQCYFSEDTSNDFATRKSFGRWKHRHITRLRWWFYFFEALAVKSLDHRSRAQREFVVDTFSSWVGITEWKRFGVE